MSKIFGYIRVSTATQNIARQLEGEHDIDEMFIDKISGGTRERPELDRLLSVLRKGDTIKVHSVDRLARSIVDLMDIVNQVKALGANLVFIKDSLTFTNSEKPSAMQTMQLQILGVFAEFERAIINTRAEEGRLRAKERGVKVGRPQSITGGVRRQIESELAMGKSVKKVAIDCDISRSTVYRIKREMDAMVSQL